MIRRFVAWFSVLAALTLGAVAVWTRAPKPDVARESVEAVVRRGDLVLEAPVSGTIEAERNVELTAPISQDPHMFKIARMAPEGKLLQPGEMVMELDSQELRQKMADYQAEEGRIEEELRRRRLEYDVQFKDLNVAVEEARVKAETARHKLLAPLEIISAHDRRLFTIDRDQADQDAVLLKAKGAAVERMATAELRSLETTLEQVRLRVQHTQARMDACTVKAPIGGTLVYKVMSNGAKRKVGEQTCHHEITLQIPDMSTLRLNAVIDESSSSKVMPGQSVRVRVDALPDRPISGKVKSVGSILRMKRFDMPVKVVDAVIELEDTGGKLTPGMTATGQVEIERASGALMIPLDFVQQSEGRTVVRVPEVQTGGWKEVAVQPGRRNTEVVEVLNGLREGQRVVK